MGSASSRLFNVVVQFLGVVCRAQSPTEVIGQRSNRYVRNTLEIIDLRECFWKYLR